MPDLASAAAAAVVPGTVLLGKYRVERVVGQGGMGVVVQATHLGLDERVAIKFLRADIAQVDGAMARFLREAQAAAKLKSEHVARVMDVGTFDWGAPYMVMEFLDGIDLGVMLSQHGRLDPALVAELMLQTCAALAEAHAHGIIHRDIKPENLFITWRGDGSPLVKLVDFGISKAVMGVDVRLTQTQSVLGTPAYMSPEQMRSARLVDPRSDQWSIGVVLYELVAGRLPFQAESFSELVVQVVSDPPAPLPPDVPPALAAVIARCLAKSVDERYPSVAELGRALVPLVRDTRQAELLAERMARLPTRRAATPPPTALPTPLPGASSGLTEVPPPAAPPARPPMTTPGVHPGPTTPTPTPTPAPAPSAPAPGAGRAAMTTPGPAPVTPRVELPDVRAEPALTALMPGRATIADAQAAARGGDTVLGAPPATPARRTRLVIALGLLALVGAGIGAAVALGDDDASPAALPGAGATSSAGAATDARPAPPLADAAPPPPFDAPRAPIPPDATPSGAAPDAASTPTPDAGLASPGIPPSKPPAKPPAKPPSKPPTKPPTKPGCDPKDILNCRDPRKR